MARITTAMLEAKVKKVNEYTGSPVAPYSETATGHKANIGNYHISECYGGVSLHQMQNEAGGTRDVFRCGHVTKRDLFDWMNAYLDGYLDAKYDGEQRQKAS